jgi:hypothetical protein
VVSQNPYAVLTRDALLAREREAIASVTSVLGITEQEAVALLRRYKW